MGFYPPLWGPTFWDTLMMMAMNFPHNPTEKEKEILTTWFELTMRLLPCDGIVFKSFQYVLNHKPDVSNKHNLIRYIVDFHNIVNISLGKSTYTVKQAKESFMERMKKKVKIYHEQWKFVKKMQKSGGNIKSTKS